MNNRLRLFIIALAILCLANIAWRAWSGRGRITINANDRPISEVIRSVEKQAGIRLRSNLPADAKVTLHVRNVPLLHALDVLAASTDANWTVSYFAAPDQQMIDTALAAIATGQEVEGWKRFALPPMRGIPDMDQGITDPRFEEWQPKPAGQGVLHAYLEQASHLLSAQFWVPEQWNPAVNTPPKSGKITDVMPKLAKTAHGKSAEIFLLRGRPQRPPEVAGTAQTGQQSQPGAGRIRMGGPGGPPSEEMLKALEERERAQIARLPKDKQSDALARLDERKKFFEEMSRLTPEERQAKMEERMEQMMSKGDAYSRMSAEGTKRGAMKSADQRADGYRGYLDRKRGN